MRKAAAIGTAASAAIALATGAALAANGHADQVTTPVSGTMAPVVNTCFGIVDAFNMGDCSYAGTRFPGKTGGGSGNGPATVPGSWIGPVFSTGFYAPGSPADPANAGLGYRPAPGDDKYAIPLLGSIVIDDKGTDSPADDTLAATWVFGAAVYNTQIGNGDFAIETWDSFTHVMAATAVNPAATAANASGGFDYVIGSRGKPTPVTGAFPHTGLAGDGLINPDPFPSERALADLLSPELRWSTSGSTDITNVSQRVGIERSPGFGNISGNPYPGTATLQPNIGGQTTGSFTNYRCVDDPGDDDCITSEMLFGSRSEGGGVTGPPGFENVILLLSTDADGRVVKARTYWTREYLIRIGSPIGNDPAPLGQRITKNSWTGGRFDFRGCSLPVAADDTASVIEGTASATLPVLNNDTMGCAEPNRAVIVSPPLHGTATVSSNGRAILYTPGTTEPPPNIYYDGSDYLTYKLVDGQDNESAPARDDITVTKKHPTAGNLNGRSSNAAPVTVTALTTSSLGSGGIGEHTLTAGAGTLGSCAVSGTGGKSGDQLTFTPTAGAGNGSGGCNFTITDIDGDAATGKLLVDVTGNAGGGSGSDGPQLPSGGGSLDLLSLGALAMAIPLLRRRRHQHNRLQDN